MPSSPEHASSAARGAGDDFATTQWSLVVAAGQPHGSAARDALAALCQLYWYPLYAYVRRRTPDLHAAQDLTQAFFVQLLERQTIAVADAERGRFRAFLLTSLKHFLVNHRESEQAAKRGGGRRLLSLDFDSGESRLSHEPADTLTPERMFERQWTMTLLERVIGQLDAESLAAGKQWQFETLKPYLAGPSAEHPYAAAAKALDLSEDAVRQAVHRLRKRYREILRSEVAQTVADPADVEDELRGLLTSL